MLLWTHIDVNKILISFEDTICGQQGTLKKIIFLKTLEFKSFKNTQLLGDPWPTNGNKALPKLPTVQSVGNQPLTNSYVCWGLATTK
jgi:hypothetical protein